MKKKAVLILLTILVNVFLIQAINLDIKSKPVSNSYIIGVDQPAVFNLSIENLGDEDSFTVYSLVGINIIHEPLFIEANQSKTVLIELSPQGTLKEKETYPFLFEYKIKNSKDEIQDESISINIVKLGSAFDINTENIDPDSDVIIISIKNKLIYDFKDIKLKVSSAFFSHEEVFSLNPREEKKISIPIDKEKLKKLLSGSFIIDSEFDFKGIKADILSQISFMEKESIEASSTQKGSLIKTTEIIKKNIGNVQKSVSILEERSFFASLFTTSNIPPTKTEFKDFIKQYVWEKDLNPNEELKVILKTNWVIPIVIIIIIIILIILYKRAVYSNLRLDKKVSFIKTKGGQFALKVTLKVKAKDFVENIKVIDKIPHLVRLYHKFGLIEPDNIDETSRRLEWNIQSLNKDETRIFSYIIYSKIGVVGRFELPEAKAIYEKDDKLKETISNRSFYINEPSE